MRFVYLLLFSVITLNAQAQHYRLKTLSYEWYSWDSLKFIAMDTYSYNYSKGRGGEISYQSFAKNEFDYRYRYPEYVNSFNADMKYDSCFFVHYFNKTYKSTINQYFDGNDNIVLRNMNTIPTTVTAADSFIYISNKMAYSHIVSGYYNTNGIKIYHYNLFGQLDTITIPSFKKTIYTYNINGTIFSVSEMYKNNSYAFFNNLRSTYNYNTSGQLTAITRDQYDTVAATFNRNGYRQFYTYTTANDTNEILEQRWDYTTSSWVDISKRIFSFDANHNVLSTVFIEWKNSMWDTLRRSNYTYNSLNQLVMNMTDFWNKTTHNWEYRCDTYAFGNSQRFTFIYEPYFPTSLTSSKINNESIRLYPIPASRVLNIEVKKEIKTHFKATILDMQGRLYTEWEEEPCTIYSRSIPIDNLPNGMYCIKLKTAEGEIAKQFVVER